MEQRNSINDSQPAVLTDKLTLCDDGVYRWIYKLPLLKNPVVLLTVYKIFALILLCFYPILALPTSLGDDAFWSKLGHFTRGYLLFGLGMFVLTLLGYVFYAIKIGRYYIVLFEMDEYGLRHTQLPSQFNQAKLLARLTTRFAKKASLAGVGLLAGTKDSSYTDWIKVRRIRLLRRLHTIKLDAPFNRNQVYVHDEDYYFLLTLMSMRCHNAKLRGKKAGTDIDKT